MLIHKTMKMPTSCLSCWIAPTCDVWVREKSKHKGYDNRLVNCPLEEVKHGHWIKDRLVSTSGGTYGVYRCSKCEWYGQDIGYSFNYCPHCGAKMDEVTE